MTQQKTRKDLTPKNVLCSADAWIYTCTVLLCYVLCVCLCQPLMLDMEGELKV